MTEKRGSGGMYLGGKGTHTVVDSNVSGQDVGIEVGDEATTLIYDSTIVDNLVGIVVRGKADVDIIRSHLDNIIDDIIQHPATDVDLYDTVAKRIMEATRYDLNTASGEMNQKARDVFRADDDEESEKRFRELAWKAAMFLGAVGSIIGGVHYLFSIIMYIWNNLP